MLVAFAEVGDELEATPADRDSLAITGPFAKALVGADNNLVFRALAAFRARWPGALPAGLALTLRKNLPIAAGLGGGSADAAAALRGLCKLWNLSPSPDDLNEIALSLGSDVPVCLVSKSAWMTGRGEHVMPMSLPRLSMVLVNPGVSISTAEVFANLHSRTGVGAPKPGAIHSADELVAYLKTTTNDLEAPARAIAPVIEEVLTALLNCGGVLARMSGSGATCFGIFEDDAKAANAASVVSRGRPGWWVKSAHTI